MLISEGEKPDSSYINGVQLVDLVVAWDFHHSTNPQTTAISKGNIGHPTIPVIYSEVAHEKRRETR